MKVTGKEICAKHPTFPQNSNLNMHLKAPLISMLIFFVLFNSSFLLCTLSCLQRKNICQCFKP